MPCIAAAQLKLRLRHSQRARVTTVEVYVNGKRWLRRRGDNLRAVTLTRIPRGRFTVRIVKSLSNERTLSYAHAYRACSASRRGHHSRRRG